MSTATAQAQTCVTPSAFGLNHSRVIDPHAIRPGMDIARVVVTSAAQTTETLRVHEVTDAAFVAARGGTISRDVPGAAWFVLGDDPELAFQKCTGCGEEVTVMHEFAHRDAIHVDSQSRWCTTESGAAWPRKNSQGVAA